MSDLYPDGFTGHLPGEGPWYCTCCGERHPERDEPDEEGRCEECAMVAEEAEGEVDSE